MTLAPMDQQETGLTRAGLEHTREQLDLLEQFVKDVLRIDQDYGVIPGTGSKPTLLKPGAANVIAAFNCHSEPFCDQRTVDPVLKYVSYEYHVDVIHNATGKVMARGAGECNSHEVKYRYRELKKTCPSCGNPAIIKGKEEYGGGWLCWRRQGGCGVKFHDGDSAIEDQPTGRIENEDPLDQTNTYMKMAIKRAEVDAALRLPGVARFFTQDLEDMKSSTLTTDDPTEEPEPAPKRQPARQQRKPAESTLTEEGLRDLVAAESIDWGEFEIGVLGTTWETWTSRGGTPDAAKAKWDRGRATEAPEANGKPTQEGEQ